jgi:type I restriction-modification system DNA methylase subunit
MNAPKTPTQLKAAIVTSLTAINHVRFFRAFDDWLALAVNAFLRDDPEYMKIMATYGPRVDGKKHPADHFSEALGAWILAMQTQAQDYLGQIYEEQSVTNKYAGQYFTPEPLVDLMMGLTCPDLDDDQVLADPAGCGSGRMLIAGIAKNRFATFVGVDTDLTCVHMATLNCLVRNANTYIIHGNALAMTAMGGFAVRRTWAGGELYRMTQEQAQSLLVSPFMKASTLTSHQSLATVTTPTPDAPLPTFTVNKKGQMGFDF